LDYANILPAVAAAFNTSCTASCTVTTCSCTQSNFYWSATTGADRGDLAWVVGFDVGTVGRNGKTGTDFSLNYVRAMRGGV